MRKVFAMNKNKTQALGDSHFKTPPFEIKQKMLIPVIYKRANHKSQKDYVELVYFDHGCEVRINRDDIELMGEELDEAEELINQYHGHLTLCFNTHGQLALDKINCYKSLDLDVPNLDRKIKDALLKQYPTYPMQTRKYLFKAIKFHLNYSSGKHTWLDEFSLSNIADADF
jgi:hypothetical protein